MYGLRCENFDVVRNQKQNKYVLITKKNCKILNY